MAEPLINDDFNERREFKDRAATREPGPARAVAITGRCADCWERIAGTKDADGRVAPHRVPAVRSRGRWAGRRVRSRRNAAGGRRQHGRSAHRGTSGIQARREVVLKLIPDMDRDKAKVDRRIAASLEEGKPRRLPRHEIPTGTAGYLYAQAAAFLARIENENFARVKSAIALSDFMFGEPQLVGGPSRDADGTLLTNVVSARGPHRGARGDPEARRGTTAIASVARSGQPQATDARALRPRRS